MKKPNILLLFTDMQRADTIAALGNPVIKTPNLDRLVNEGTAFSNCYTPSPVCCSARCSMHYGLYTQQTGLFGNGRFMDDNGKSYPEILGKAGYQTKSVGKCHFTPDSQALRGFDSRATQEEVVAENDDYIDFLKENNFDWYEPHGARGEMYYIPQISSLSAEKAHPTTWVADRSIDFIKNADKDKPWCLFSSYIHPHPPFAPPKPWHKLYRSPLMPLPYVPDNPKANYTWVNVQQNRYKYRDQGIDLQLMRNIKAYYYATISFVDYQIGRIFEVLEERGELDNTLIVFSSDHGEYLGDYECFGKRGMQDASSKVPMLVRYPERFDASVVSNTPVSLVDVLPTFMSAAGVEVNSDEYDGEDLSVLAKGNTERKYVYSQYDSEQYGIYMIADERYKFIYSAGDDKEFLYDRFVDPKESRNIVATPFTREIKNEIKQALLKYLSDNDSTAVESVGGEIKWKKYPPYDFSRYENPDAGLLIQDSYKKTFDVPGYT
jgi:arylsulfatase